MAISKADRLGKDPRTGEWMEPEKKDVWEVAAAKIAQDAWAEDRYANFSEIIYQNIKSLVKTHFIPRAEVVEKASKIAYLSDDLGGGKAVPLDDLLDLIKNNE